MAKISVIITVYNNNSTIYRCLDAILNQTLTPESYELIIVSDGSTDETDAIIEEYQVRNHNLHLFKQKNQGVSVARNLGASKATSEILLFTQGDVIADQNLLQQHLNYHQTHPNENQAMVGFTTWHTSMKITPFMVWLEHGGPQFNFDRIKDDHATDFLTFYTTNISLKKSFFNQSGGFDVNFKGPTGVTAYEDTDLGYRLQGMGMSLYYEPKAVAYHLHYKQMKDVLKRRYHEGVLAHLLTRKHPKIQWERKFNDQTIFLMSFWLLNPVMIEPLRWIALLLQSCTNAPLIFKLVTRAYYNWGYLNGYFNHHSSKN